MLSGEIGRPRAVVSLLGARTAKDDGSSELDDGFDALVPALGDCCDVLFADSSEQALEQLARRPPPIALIVNLARVGSRSEAVERIRADHPLLPILAVVDGNADPARIQHLKCEMCELPVNVRTLRNFVLRAQGFQRLQVAWRAWLVEYGAKTYGLSSRAIGLLAQAVSNAGPGPLLAELGVSQHTLEAQITRLLRPANEATQLERVDELLGRLLASTALCRWDGQRAEDFSASVLGEPALRH